MAIRAKAWVGLPFQTTLDTGVHGALPVQALARIHLQLSYWADMAGIVIGQSIGKMLTDVLSLPKHTKSFVLRCEVDKLVLVECEYYPEIDAGSLEVALAEFDLVRRVVPALPKVVDFDTWLAQRKEEAHAAMMARHVVLSRLDKQALAFNGLMRWAHA